MAKNVGTNFKFSGEVCVVPIYHSIPHHSLTGPQPGGQQGASPQTRFFIIFYSEKLIFGQNSKFLAPIGTTGDIFFIEIRFRQKNRKFVKKNRKSIHYFCPLCPQAKPKTWLRPCSLTIYTQKIYWVARASPRAPSFLKL